MTTWPGTSIPKSTRNAYPPAPYEVKRANDERDKRYARIAKARKAQKRKTHQ